MVYALGKYNLLSLWSLMACTQQNKVKIVACEYSVASFCLRYASIPLSTVPHITLTSNSFDNLLVVFNALKEVKTKH